MEGTELEGGDVGKARERDNFQHSSQMLTDILELVTPLLSLETNAKSSSKLEEYLSTLEFRDPNFQVSLNYVKFYFVETSFY